MISSCGGFERSCSIPAICVNLLHDSQAKKFTSSVGGHPVHSALPNVVPDNLVPPQIDKVTSVATFVCFEVQQLNITHRSSTYEQPDDDMDSVGTVETFGSRVEPNLASPAVEHVTNSSLSCSSLCISVLVAEPVIAKVDLTPLEPENTFAFRNPSQSRNCSSNFVNVAQFVFEDILLELSSEQQQRCIRCDITRLGSQLTPSAGLIVLNAVKIALSAKCVL